MTLFLHDGNPLLKGHWALGEQRCLLARHMDLAGNVAVT